MYENTGAYVAPFRGKHSKIITVKEQENVLLSRWAQQSFVRLRLLRPSSRSGSSGEKPERQQTNKKTPRRIAAQVPVRSFQFGSLRFRYIHSLQILFSSTFLTVWSPYTALYSIKVPESSTGKLILCGSGEKCQPGSVPRYWHPDQDSIWSRTVNTSTDPLPGA